MPRYFFHLADSSERILDPDGVELMDDAQALLEATQAVKEFLDENQLGWSGWSIQIVAEGNRVVGSIPLDEAKSH